MLDKTGGNVTRAAELAGVNRRFLQRMMARLGIRSAGGDDELRSLRLHRRRMRRSDWPS